MARKHDDPAYRRLARQVRAAAYADESTRCWRPECRRTLSEVRQSHPRAEWDAGHLGATLADGLAAECSPCNRSNGAAVGNRSRHGNALGL